MLGLYLCLPGVVKRLKEVNLKILYGRAVCQGKEYQQCFVNASTAAAAMALSAISPEKKPRKNRLANEQRDRIWWANGSVNWTDKQFKKRFRLNKITFD